MYVLYVYLCPLPVCCEHLASKLLWVPGHPNNYKKTPQILALNPLNCSVILLLLISFCYCWV